MALCGRNLDSDEATSRPQQTHRPGNPTWPCDECGLWPPFLGGEENTQNDDPARMRLPDKARKDAAHAGQSSEAAASIATAVDAGKESHLHRSPERNKDTTFHCTCPFGDVAINSIVRSGQVDTASIAATNFGSKLDASRQKKKVSGARFLRRQRGKQRDDGATQPWERVGQLVLCQERQGQRTTRQHVHKCPQCRTVVWSAAPRGEFACMQHLTPSGRPCPRNSWKKRQQHRTVEDGRLQAPSRAPKRVEKSCPAAGQGAILKPAGMVLQHGYCLTSHPDASRKHLCNAWQMRLLPNVAF